MLLLPAERSFSPPQEKWWKSAACADVENPDIFYPDIDSDEHDTLFALMLCAKCPVKDACLAHAITEDERIGIWGGMTEQQRREIARSSHGSATHGWNRCTKDECVQAHQRRLARIRGRRLE